MVGDVLACCRLSVFNIISKGIYLVERLLMVDFLLFFSVIS